MALDTAKKNIVSKGIECIIASPGTMSQKVAQSKAWGAELYMPMHTNATSNGGAKGTRFGFYTGRGDSSRACTIFKNRWVQFYPYSQLVHTCTYPFSEAKNPRCPSVYCEIIFHSNKEDAAWFHNNLDGVANQLALCVQDFFNVAPSTPDKPKEEPMNFTNKFAKVNTKLDAGLSLWTDIKRSQGLVKVAKGGIVKVLTDNDSGWCFVEYSGFKGYVDKQYLIATDSPVIPPTNEYAAELMQIADRLRQIAQGLVEAAR